MMKTSALVINHLLGQDAVALGRLVLNVHSPEQDYFDLHFNLDVADVVIQKRLNFSDVLLKTSGSRLHGFLTSLLGGLAKDDIWQSQISSVCNTTYQIKNSSTVFARACETDRAKQWLENAIARGRKVYFVVGIQTMLDAELREQGTREEGWECDLTVPVGTAIGAGVRMPSTSSLDIGGRHSRNSTRNRVANFLAPGEQVYAVQYRKVDFSWFFSRRLENIELEKGNRWKVYWHNRSAVDDDEEDVVEANLMEDFSISDMDSGCECVESYEVTLLFS